MSVVSWQCVVCCVSCRCGYPKEHPAFRTCPSR
jgi:hypothetical protein